MSVLYYVGYVILLKWLVEISLIFWHQFRLFFLTRWFKKDLTKYGEWAIVTGASDGIGKAFCQELARRGLNIVLISRSKDKLEDVERSINEECPHIETKVVVFDFATKDAADYSQIEKEIEDLDIGLLINNVGMAYGTDSKYFSNADLNRSLNLISVNEVSDVTMTHMVLGRMVQKKKGIIVHVSSGTALHPFPFLNIYGATKAFVSYFARQMQIESASYKDIEHQLLRPHFVSTKMSGMATSVLSPTPDDYAKSAINTMGICAETTGYWTHELQALFLALPSWLITGFMIWSLKQRKKSTKKRE